jgi:exonuclease III
VARRSRARGRCLQELKGPEGKFPLAALKKTGYGAIWHGQKSREAVVPIPLSAGAVADPEDMHSRYIETRSGTLYSAVAEIATWLVRPRVAVISPHRSILN